MKLKMSDKSLFAVLLRSPWWISLLITLAIAGAARAALPTEYWITGAMGATPFFVIAVVAAWKQWQTPSPAATAQTLETATAMPWRDFAQSLEDALRLDGYEVERLGSKNSTNSAADFCLTRHGRTVLMSCKRWKAASHGVEPLRELQALRTTKGVQEAWFVALGNVSDQAARFARENQLQFIQGPELAHLLRKR
jgi:restriction system protein